ncbi:MAG: hypothetical protein GX558_04205 [Clostridiales bacterium]|nr:hypothetical protein [Clostridiales bacterium]
MAGKGDDPNWIFIALMLFFAPPFGVYLLIRALNATLYRTEADAQQRRDAERAKKAAGLLLVGAVVLMALTGALRWGNWRAMTMLGVLYAAGGMAWRYVSHKRASMRRKYLAVIGGRGAVSISEIAAAMPVRYERACADLQGLIDRGQLPATAYLDMHRRMLVMHPDALVDVEPVVNAEPAPAAEARQSEETPNRTAFQARVDELHRLNEAIEGEVVSAKIDKIERLTASIFLAVEDSPTKLPQISRFMNYYLPTTIKLLAQYSRLERQALGGENIARSMRDIEAILDKLVEGFERQLDQLYSADMIDITADINVLETMMARDGLTRNPYVFERQGQS